MTITERLGRARQRTYAELDVGDALEVGARDAAREEGAGKTAARHGDDGWASIQSLYSYYSYNFNNSKYRSFYFSLL